MWTTWTRCWTDGFGRKVDCWPPLTYLIEHGPACAGIGDASMPIPVFHVGWLTELCARAGAVGWKAGRSGSTSIRAGL